MKISSNWGTQQDSNHPIIRASMPDLFQRPFIWLVAPEDAAPPVRWPGRAADPAGGAPIVTLHLWPRWLFLRGLGLIYFSAFYSLLFQIRGLIGPHGILPANEYLSLLPQYLHGIEAYWFAPTLFWFSSTDRALSGVCWIGLAASILLLLNIWPRGALLLCFAAFLSFVAASQDFSSYQSDGMLLEAGFLSLFFAPPGLRPRLGVAHAPSRLSLFLLRWLWFRIYFESGAVKILGGDLEWRHFTAMDDYYQNGPLPTWIGWYVQHWPHWFHAATAGGTLFLELVLVWMLFLPRRFRIICFFIVTPWQIAIILTANYTFLNYLVLLLGMLLLDDEFLRRWLPVRRAEVPNASRPGGVAMANGGVRASRLRNLLAAFQMSVAATLLGLQFYTSTALLLFMFAPSAPLPTSPVRFLEPFRIADQYGLFAQMTRGRYEIEFQGSNDGENWTPYPFRYKPQNLSEAPHIYAPYQPRFDWNLWFASLGMWRDYPIVPRTEQQLLEGSTNVLALFAGNPFPQGAPRMIRAVLWQYWFTDEQTKRTQGLWWRREYLGLYAPALQRQADGTIVITELPVQRLQRSTPP
jgi:lipase maturation factor 1